ncbi:MAG: hypothetical protein MR423_00930 [Firmicutes bacterium]|nr:hypothetical protein [Bacillota bacterium]MDY3659122.1 hypothetical protein [Eubacteriales bacterium]
MLLSIFFVACSKESSGSIGSAVLGKTETEENYEVVPPAENDPIDEPETKEEPKKDDNDSGEIDEPDVPDREAESEDNIEPSVPDCGEEKDLEEEEKPEPISDKVEICFLGNQPCKCGTYRDGSHEIYTIKITSCRKLSIENYIIEKSDNIIVVENSQVLTQTEKGTELCFSFYFVQNIESYMKASSLDDNKNVVAESEKITFELEEIIDLPSYSFEFSSSDEVASYDFENDVIEVDFALSKSVYFGISLLKDGKCFATSTLTAKLSDESFGVFSTPIYNRIYLKLKKTGEFSLTIADVKYEISRTIKIVVR